MIYGSVCTGIGGLDLAIEELFGAEPLWFAETDPAASKVLARHWPNVPNLGNIKSVDWDSVPKVDLLCGGPPCQSVSVAGKRLGPDDERFLWPEVLDIVGRLRPGRLVFENPPGIAPWLPAILCRLAELGYVGRFGRLTASAIGACHKRERVFIVAIVASDASGERRGSFGGKPGARRQAHRHPPKVGARSDCAPTADSDPNGTDEPLGQPRSDPAALSGTSSERTRFPWGKYQPAIDRHERIFGRPHPWPTTARGRSASGDFYEWMMMFPEGWLDGLSHSAKRRVCGNAVVTPQAIAAIGEMAEKSTKKGKQ